MNGPHDMGGMQCYGPVKPEFDEPVFHGDWEKRALALTVAMGFTGMWNIDTSRHARESLPPIQYLSSTYYQIWLAGLERLMLERGMITAEELQTGKAISPAKATNRPAPDRAGMKAGLAAGGPSARECDTPPAFRIGDTVRTLQINPKGHTRLPGYARGKTGKIIHYNGTHVFPDSAAHGKGDDPQPLYTVEFTASDLFGIGSHSVTLDLWEPYLEAVI